MPAIMLFIISLFIAFPLHATTDYCSVDSHTNFIRLNLETQDRQQLNTTPPSQNDIAIRSLESSWQFNPDKQHSQSIGFNFSYTIMDIDPIEPMTNGHLHTWDFPLDGRVENPNATLFYNITPALAVSSNVLKNPDLIDENSFQLYTGLVYKKPYSITSDWLIGFRSDHRFGPYRGYPVVGVCIRPSNDWTLQLALPDLSLSKTFAGGNSIKLFAKPVGNSWHVFSKDKTQQSDFIYNATAIGISAQWAMSDSIQITLDLEKQTDREFSFVLNDNALVGPNAESSMGLALKGEMLF